jgi:serine/threonine protein kinase
MGVMVRKGATNDAGRGARLVPGLAVRAGQTVAGKYRVDELLGSGASGVVIAAHSIFLREPVTLKILASYTDGQEEVLRRRLTKARVAARLQSKHVARILDIGVTEDGMSYVATEAMKGTTLECELAERGRLDVAEATRWVLETCEGLAEAHAVGLVHGDLKPQNIFLADPKKQRGRRDGRGANEDAFADARVLKILDFGTTSPLDAIGDRTGAAFFGSPAFLAPEQIQDASSVDARADVWALGVLLYNLISGDFPFEADTLSGVIVAVVYDAPSLLTDAPYDLARIVHRCLEKDPAKRPQDVRELAAALAPFAGRDGARMSERVRVALEDPGSSRPRPPVNDASGSGSFSPVSMSIEPDANTIEDSSLAPRMKRREEDEYGREPPAVSPGPSRDPSHSDKLDAAVDAGLDAALDDAALDDDVLDSLHRHARVPADAPTRPSLYVIAKRRRSYLHGTLTVLAAAAAVPLAALSAPYLASAPALYVRAKDGVTQAVLQAQAALDARQPNDPIELPPATPPSSTTPAPAPSAAPSSSVAPSPRAVPAPDAPVSFGATRPGAMTPTPLVATATPLVVPIGPPTPTTRGSRLPPGLPTTRDGLSTPPPRGVPHFTHPSSLSTSRNDDQARKLTSTRK